MLGTRRNLCQRKPVIGLDRFEIDRLAQVVDTFGHSVLVKREHSVTGPRKVLALVKLDRVDQHHFCVVESSGIKKCIAEYRERTCIGRIRLGYGKRKIVSLNKLSLFRQDEG